MKLKQKNKENASVLVIALVVVAVGTIGVLAGVSIISYRSDLAETEFVGLERRIKFTNSKALAKKALYQEFLSRNATSTGNNTFALSDGWGTATIPAISDAALGFNAAVRTHPTGAAAVRAFSTDVLIQLNDGVSDQPLQFQLKSYNPVLGGDLLSVHPTSETAAEQVRFTGDLRVEGRAVFWPADYLTTAASTVRSNGLVLPSTNPPQLVMENLNNEPILPSNYQNFPQTTGENSLGTPYDGQLELVQNTNSSINSYFTRLAAFTFSTAANGTVGSTDGLGDATIPPGANDLALINAVLDLTINENTLVGQLASNSPLSSNVIITVLNRPVPVTSALLLPILQSQGVMPDDVISELAKFNSGLTQEEALGLMDAASYSYVSTGDGTVLINTSSDSLQNLALENVDQLLILGQPTADPAIAGLQPRAFAVLNPENVLLSNVRFIGETNTRRLALAISQTGVLDNSGLTNADGSLITTGNNLTNFTFEQSSPFVNWNMIVETEGVSAQWDVSSVSTAFLIGGIRTDHSIRVVGGALQLQQMQEAEFIESLLSRNAWIEVYR